MACGWGACCVNGADIYREIDEWYQETKVYLSKLLKETPVPFQKPADIQKPLQIMEYAMECEGMLIELASHLSIEQIGDIEMKLRGIRDSLGRMVAESIRKDITDLGYTLADYGISVCSDNQGGFIMTIPYEMISMSDLFMLRSKRISGLSSLATVRDAWVAIIRAAAVEMRKLVKHPFQYAEVTVQIDVTHQRPLDPDHFWIRPILDGLVENFVLVNDDANSLEFIQRYHTSQNENHVSLHVRPASRIRDKTSD